MTMTPFDIFVWLFGLCVGSFLNVVIYRLPLGLSIASPRRSFCPMCRHTLAWYDNLPVLSWIVLRARCRNCRVPISAQYPLIEALTGLVFVLVFRLLFDHAARVGLPAPLLPADAAYVLAWLVLAAVLIACAAIDIVSYMIDTAVTNLAVLAGIVLLSLWGNAAFVAPTAAQPLAAAAVAAFVVSVFMLWRTVWSLPDLPPDAADTATADTPAAPAPAPRETFGSVVLVLPLIALTIWAMLDPTVRPPLTPAQQLTDPPVHAALPSWIRHCGLAIPAGIATIFLVMVISAGRPRDADAELHEAIEEEAPQARRLALAELLWLAPSVAAGALAYALVAYTPGVAAAWNGLTGLAPVGGAVFAIHGAMIGAAAGWVVRIFFTLVFGREAFGVGDIYILAAAGACAGWDIALLGFLASIGVALLSFAFGLALKRSSMIAFGPPLAIGFLIALWLNRPAAVLAQRMFEDVSDVWSRQPVLLGSLLVGSFVIAIVLSRLLRRALESGDDAGPADAPRS